MKYLLIALFLFSNTFLFGSSDHFSNYGKINTVIACVSVLIIGIGIFLFYLERRLSKIEKEEKN